MHERIRWRDDTAEAVASFLETGKFDFGISFISLREGAYCTSSTKMGGGVILKKVEGELIARCLVGKSSSVILGISGFRFSIKVVFPTCLAPVTTTAPFIFARFKTASSI